MDINELNVFRDTETNNQTNSDKVCNCFWKLEMA